MKSIGLCKKNSLNVNYECKIDKEFRDEFYVSEFFFNYYETFARI